MACKLTYKGVQYDSDDAVIQQVIKDNNLIAEYNTLVESDTSSSIEELQSFAAEKKRLLEVLPDNIFTITDKNRLLDRVINNGVTFGYVYNRLIYLAKNSPIGTGYHEAFHAVFRTFLSDDQITNYLQKAKEEFGVPTQAQLTKLKNSSSSYANLSKEKIVNLYYEEKMAEKFRDYMLNKKPKTFFTRLFNYLKKIINYFTNTPTTLDMLFEDIAVGKFKKAKPVHNIYRKSKPAFSVTTFTNSSNPTILNTVDYEQVISSIASYAIKSGNEKLTNANLVQYMDMASMQFDPERWMPYLEGVEEGKKQQTINRLAEIYNVLVDGELFVNNAKVPYQKTKLNNKNLNNIRKSVKVYLDLFHIDKEQEIEEEYDADDNVRPGLGIEDSATKGSIYKMNKFIRTYVGTVKMYKDHFDLGLDFTDEFINTLTPSEQELHKFYASPSLVFNTFRNNLSDTPKNKVFDKFINLNKDNKDLKAFQKNVLTTIKRELREQYIPEKFLTDRYIKDHAGNPQFIQILNKSNLFNAITNAFNLTRVNLQTIVTDSEYAETNIYDASAIKELDQVLYKWRTNAVNKNNNLDETKTILADLDSALTINFNTFKKLSTKERADLIYSKATDVVELFETLGITVSKDLILFELVSSYVDRFVDMNKDNIDAVSIIQADKLLPQSLINLYDNNYNSNTLVGVDNVRLVIRPATNYTPKEEVVNVIVDLLNSIDNLKVSEDENAIVKLLEKEFNNQFSSLKRLAALNTTFDDSFKSSVARTAEGKTVNSLGLPSFYSDLILTLKSVRMKQFINLVGQGKILEAKNMFYQMFGEDSVFQYDDYTINKLFLSYVNNPFIVGTGKSRIDVNYELKNLVFSKLTNAVSLDFKVGNKSIEYSDLDIVGKLVAKMSLYNKPPDDSNTSFSFFLPQIHEGKKYNRAVQLPTFKLAIKDTVLAKEFGVNLLSSNFKAEYDSLVDNIKYLSDAVYVDDQVTKLKEGTKLIENYNVVYKSNNIYVPIFTKNKTGYVFKQFALLNRVYNDYGVIDWQKSNLVLEETGELDIRSLPSGYSFNRFEDFNDTDIHNQAMRGIDYGNMSSISVRSLFTSLNEMLDTEFDRFLQMLLETNLLKQSENIYEIKEVKC